MALTRPHWGWLAVAIAVLVIAFMVLGTIAEDRWCGAVLCESLSKY